MGWLCMDCLSQADVVILAGAICDFRLDYGRSLSRKSKIITVNRNPASLDQNAGGHPFRCHSNPHALCGRVHSPRTTPGSLCSTVPTDTMPLSRTGDPVSFETRFCTLGVTPTFAIAIAIAVTNAVTIAVVIAVAIAVVIPQTCSGRPVSDCWQTPLPSSSSWLLSWAARLLPRSPPGPQT